MILLDCCVFLLSMNSTQMQGTSQCISCNTVWAREGKRAWKREESA